MADRAAWIGEQELPGFRGGIDVRVSLRTDAGPACTGPGGHARPTSPSSCPSWSRRWTRRGVQVTRFTYPFATWHAVPRKLAVGDRLVRVGGFATGDPQLVSLTCGPTPAPRAAGVPPGTEALFSARALRMAAHPGAALTARAVLTAAGRHPALRTGEIPVQTAG